MGVAIALDDFGIGYSSLTSLEQLPITRVKLDRMLVEAVDSSPRSAAIARSIIALCHGLGLQVVAEGVERAPQLEFLSRCGPVGVQGYLLAHPVMARCRAHRSRGRRGTRAQGARRGGARGRIPTTPTRGRWFSSSQPAQAAQLSRARLRCARPSPRAHLSGDDTMRHLRRAAVAATAFRWLAPPSRRHRSLCPSSRR